MEEKQKGSKGFGSRAFYMNKCFEKAQLEVKVGRIQGKKTIILQQKYEPVKPKENSRSSLNCTSLLYLPSLKLTAKASKIGLPSQRKGSFSNHTFSGATSYFLEGYLIQKTNGRPTINQSQSLILLSFGPQNHEA